MPADAIDSPVAKARKTKRLWLWGSIGTALVAWLIVWWVSNHRISVTLPDGRMVTYVETLKGRRVNASDFEPDIYAYPENWFRPIQERILRSIERLFQSRRTGYDDNIYKVLPELLLLRSSGPPTSTDDVFCVLDDGFGIEQSLISLGSLNRPMIINYSKPMIMNTGVLPMRSQTWNIKFQDVEKKPLSNLMVPHRPTTSKPLFETENLPLESRNPIGVLKLLSANYSVSKEGDSTGGRYVTFAFDASACPDLLPCHVIGVRVTDSWGNTSLIGGSLAHDGKTIVAQWQEADHAPMQSEDWQVRIALCRGYEASFTSCEVVVFDHFKGIPYRGASLNRSIRGRELTLQYGDLIRGSGLESDTWKECNLHWQVDQKGPLLWPILVKAIGYTSEGAVVKIDFATRKRKYEGAEYQIMRNRVIEDGLSHGPGRLTQDFLFKAGFLVPKDITDLDLHVALEEPQVFEFYAKIANWPTPPSGTKP